MRFARILIALTLLASAPFAWALRPATRLYGPADGLPHTRVTSVTQDADGFLWVGTYRGGLARYDGVHWDVLGMAEGLPSRNIDFLAASPQGTVFAATPAGWGRVKGLRFEVLPGLPDGLAALVLLARSDREVWLGTEKGLFVWRADAAPVRVALGARGDAAEVLALGAAEDGALMVGTSVGLARVEASVPHAVTWPEGLPADGVSALVEMADGSLLVGTEAHGMYRGRPGAFALVKNAPGYLISLLADGAGFFAGTSGRGAFRCEADSCEPVSAPDLEAGPVVFQIFRDRDGVTWFATDSGLLKRAASTFATLEPSDGFPEPVAIYGMAETRDGAVWFAAGSQGVLRLGPDSRVRRFTWRDGLPGSTVAHVFPSADGRFVWVATRRGLARIEGDRVAIRPLPRAEVSDLSVGAAAGDGGIYLGTWRDGLFLLRGDKATLIDPGIGNGVQSLFTTPDGKVLCTSANGVFVIDGDRVVERIGREQGLPTLRARFAMGDSTGALWVGTEAGVWSRTADGRVRVLSRKDGLPDDFVNWIVEGRDGTRWFGTNAGLARLDRSGRIDVFDTKDGLASNEVSVGGGFVDSRGRLFAATRSLSILQEGTPLTFPAPPVTVLGVRTPSGVIERPAEIRLPAGSGPLTFSFASLSYIDEEGTRYRTRLGGLSDVWRVTDYRETSATYGGLPPGTYRFEVEALTGGRVSEHPATVWVVIEPRWWERTSVRLLAGLAVLLAILAAARTRERIVRRKNRELTRLIDERTEELRLANERLAAMASTDELTGLPNRRAIEGRLREAIEFARRHPPLTIALIDIDDFKRLNDTRGHATGDGCLVAAADHLRGALRAKDFVGRYGGDEFLAVLPGSDLAAARQVAERMLVLSASAGAGPVITLSIGLAEMRDGDADGAALVARADQALYEAKRAGRNRIAEAS